MNLLKKVKKNWIAVWLIAVALSLSGLVSFGAYTGVTSTKRVISLSSRDGILFSSRYMSRNNMGVQSLLFTIDTQKTDEENTPVILVDVCNYDLNQNVYDKTFHYKIKARLVNTDGSDISSEAWTALGVDIPTAYSVAYRSYSDSTNALTETYSTTPVVLTNVDQYIGSNYTFIGADKTKYLFETKFALSDIVNPRPAYAVRIEAEVVENYSDIQNIFGIIKAQQGGEATRNTWEGKFMDATGDSDVPSNYDAINYQISGNAGGTVNLTYRSDVVEIDNNDYDQFTFARASSTTTTVSGENYKTVYLTVDPEANSMYDILFYWVDGRDTGVSFDEDFIKTEFVEE